MGRNPIYNPRFIVGLIGIRLSDNALRNNTMLSGGHSGPLKTDHPRASIPGMDSTEKVGLGELPEADLRSNIRQLSRLRNPEFECGLTGVWRDSIDPPLDSPRFPFENDRLGSESEGGGIGRRARFRI